MGFANVRAGTRVLMLVLVQADLRELAASGIRGGAQAQLLLAQLDSVRRHDASEEAVTAARDMIDLCDVYVDLI